MDRYLPSPTDLGGLATTWLVAVILMLAGAAIVGRRPPPELQIGAGWGALCLLLTVWGVLTPLSLTIPAASFVLVALCVLLLPDRRPRAGAWKTLGRVALVSLPLWLVMAPIRPSQPDTWLNLLPNAFYLLDWGRLPTATLPRSDSYLPAAPYSTQFLSYLGGLLSANYPSAGMSLINVVLLLATGLLVGRALAAPSLATDAAPPWGAVAVGTLLVTLFNPGFVPRFHLSAYGETALAVTAAMGAWLLVSAQSEIAAREGPARPVPLALILSAMVGVKQSGIGLVAALAGAGLITNLAERALPRAAALRFVAAALLPSVLLYATWRYWAAHAGVAELKLRPFAEWNWRSVAATMASALAVVHAKAMYFGCVLAAFASLPILLSRQGWTPTTRLLTLSAALFTLYNAFLLLTYIAAFPAEMSEAAHSYFRYNTHLSLALVLALTLAARDLLPLSWREHLRSPRVAAAMVALVLLAPLVFVKRLRFDLDMPQPLVWGLAKHLVPYLHDGDRLALLLPGDNDSVATMLAGVLGDTPPRRRGLALLRRRKADPATLDEAARLGYPLALISCTPPGLTEAPAGEAALLRHDRDGWRLVAAWPYPAADTRQRWQHILSWAPLCRAGG
jgi:hypothetical protein